MSASTLDRVFNAALQLPVSELSRLLEGRGAQLHAVQDGAGCGGGGVSEGKELSAVKE
ncbi:MAG: hypothetical protein ACREAB_20035 [Blastocatellia bacterium]